MTLQSFSCLSFEASCCPFTDKRHFQLSGFFPRERIHSHRLIRTGSFAKSRCLSMLGAPVVRAALPQTAGQREARELFCLAASNSLKANVRATGNRIRNHHSNAYLNPANCTQFQTADRKERNCAPPKEDDWLRSIARQPNLVSRGISDEA
jgi:hypothetical protein